MTQECFMAADILLPDDKKTSFEQWAVVACDQFTSEPEYWHSAEEIVGDAPSTLNMILPEVYLEETEERVDKINEKMVEYAESILVEYPDSMIYVERTQSDKTVRRGIMLAVDLEAYDYTKGANSLIRATEATVVERIPPRVAIRRNASIELPHIMMLIDDPDKTVIEPLDMAKCGKVVYDFDLMLGGGHIKGALINKEGKETIKKALCKLVEPGEMERKYGEADLAPLLFAVGDGNHSLASAKAAYEEIKQKLGDKAASHPARYALVEVVNIHDEALQFEPIYRIVEDANYDGLLYELKDYSLALSGSAAKQRINIIIDGEVKGVIDIDYPEQQLAVGSLQTFLDDYLKIHPTAKIDYIHGEDSLMELTKKPNTVGFIFDGMEKSQLFKTVIFDGALPRKTFSMGHAVDKRYYLECRKIK